MSGVSKITHALIPGRAKRIIWEVYISLMIKFVPGRYRKLVNRLKRKEKVKVVFLMQLSSSWKYDYLFKLMLEDNQYDPIIVICPLSGHEKEAIFREMQRAMDFFSGQDYPVFNTWDHTTQQWIDIKKVLKPDIVFFSNPWAELSMPQYYIYHFLDTLTCYAPYGFKSSHLYEAIFNKSFQNLLWKIFYETEMHKSMAFKYARNKGMNGLVSGYPGMDNLLDASYKAVDVWKIKDRDIKRIIWAPHHTILGKSDSHVGFSTFLRYAEFMLEIAREHENIVQISFKPHPLLRPKLHKHPDWGKERTDNYFTSWSSMPNTQLNEGNYIDLFLTSDALINDGESFMVEYLYTGKPSMFLVADDRVTDRFNEFGKLAFGHLYPGHTETDITTFISTTVIKGNDYRRDNRIEFFENQVKPPHDLLASENIFNFINKAISKA